MLEEWLIAYQATGGEDEEDREEEKRFLAELISFVWRVSRVVFYLIWSVEIDTDNTHRLPTLKCCGLSNEISPDVADDVDGVPDRIDDVHTELQEAKEVSEDRATALTPSLLTPGPISRSDSSLPPRLKSQSVQGNGETPS